jgi:glutamyl endopeptidase
MSKEDDKVVSNTASPSAEGIHVNKEDFLESYKDPSTAVEGIDLDFDIEPGYDLQTHGGGSVESVDGFDEMRPMLEGLGNMESCGLPVGSMYLPTAAEIEYGEEASNFAETVQGVDDRVHITKMGKIPWRMICQLIITYPNGQRARGTGWFISAGTLMTAGHCVHSERAGGWAVDIEVIPGMNARLRPFGSTQSNKLRTVKGWMNGRKPTHDYGAIILPESERLGAKTGWFGYARLPDSTLKNLLANNSGYPGDKTFGTQWFNSGRITQVDKRQLHYMLDTAGGQSGSPTWRYSSSSGERQAIGIHAYGGGSNKSTRITRAVFKNMMAWKREGSE